MPSYRATHFTRFHIVSAFISTRVFGNVTYTVRHGLNKGMKRIGGLGFLPLPSRDTAETRFMRALELRGKVVYDIGAFEGLMSLFFAAKGAEVIAFEPNPRNYARCRENIALNGLNVKMVPYGVANQTGTLELAYDPLMPGAGSAETGVFNQIAESVEGARKIRIPVIRLDDGLPGPMPHFIKIDIEGLEYQALCGMRQLLNVVRPALYIELHGATVAEKKHIAESVLGLIGSLGYSILDVEASEFVTTLGQRIPSHIYCVSKCA